MNHGFHFVQHLQLFQCMLYKSLHYIFSTTVLTCYSTLCTTHTAWQLCQDRTLGSKPQVCTGILGGYGDKHKNKATTKELQSYMCIIYSILVSISDLPWPQNYKSLLLHMILPEGKKKFLEAWQKLFRSNGKDPNNSLQKLKFWVGALASWKNFFSFCICTC